MYQIKNKLLTIAGNWFVDKKTLELANKSIPVIKQFYDSDGTEDPGTPPIMEIVQEPVKEVFTLPVFSEHFVRILMDEIQNIKAQGLFEANAVEDSLRQIPEFTLEDNAPEIYQAIMSIVKGVLNPVFLSLWNRQVDGGHIQIANYNPREKKAGAWHHDHSADITVVVPLNTGDYSGGGTEFYGRGVVDPLPSGHALIFPSFTHLHRGLLVESGDRYLLVFWLTNNGDRNEKH